MSAAFPNDSFPHFFCSLHFFFFHQNNAWIQRSSKKILHVGAKIDVDFIFEWQKQYSYSLHLLVKDFYHSKIKFISSSHSVIFFLLYRQIDCLHKTTVKKARNDVINIYTCEDKENTPEVVSYKF